MTCATCSTVRSARIRSSSTERWSSGSVAAEPLDRPRPRRRSSDVVLDVAADAARPDRPASSVTCGRRLRRRQSSTSRRWAMVKTQARRRVLVAAEAGQAGEDTDERLAGQVVGLGRAVQAQVPGDGRREVAVEHLEGPGRAGLRRSEDVVEGQTRPHRALLRSADPRPPPHRQWAPDRMRATRRGDSPSRALPSGRTARGRPLRSARSRVTDPAVAGPSCWRSTAVNRALRAATMGVLLLSPVALSACSAGQVTQTATQERDKTGGQAQVGDITLRAGRAREPPRRQLRAGDDAELQLAIVNAGTEDDTLVAIDGDGFGRGRGPRLEPPRAAPAATSRSRPSRAVLHRRGRQGHVLTDRRVLSRCIQSTVSLRPSSTSPHLESLSRTPARSRSRSRRQPGRTWSAARPSTSTRRERPAEAEGPPASSTGRSPELSVAGG